MSQIALPLPSPDAMTGQAPRHELVISRCNAIIVEAISNWQVWPFLSGVLTGMAQSGKSTLGARFLENSNGMFIDDADKIDDATLFHRWNQAQTNSRPILFASQKPLNEWGVQLPDLMSRLNASQAMHLPPPDDELCALMLQQQLARRGTVIGDALAQFAATRLERSYQAIIALADALHVTALEQKRPIGQKMIRETLNEHFGAFDEPE